MSFRQRTQPTGRPQRTTIPIRSRPIPYVYFAWVAGRRTPPAVLAVRFRDDMCSVTADSELLALCTAASLSDHAGSPWPLLRGPSRPECVRASIFGGLLAPASVLFGLLRPRQSFLACCARVSPFWPAGARVSPFWPDAPASVLFGLMRPRQSFLACCARVSPFWPAGARVSPFWPAAPASPAAPRRRGAST
jgi:hypothetical protein